jgi:hypothetical protein
LSQKWWTMSETQWTYRLFGEEFGPVSFGDLRELVAAGTLTHTDEVREVGSASWILVEAAVGTDTSSVATAVLPLSSEAGDDQWFCQIAGQEFGPLRFDELADFATGGQLSSDDLVRYGDAGKWRTAGTIGRLVAILPYSTEQRSVSVLGEYPAFSDQPTPIPHNSTTPRFDQTVIDDDDTVRMPTLNKSPSRKRQSTPAPETAAPKAILPEAITPETATRRDGSTRHMASSTPAAANNGESPSARSSGRSRSRAVPSSGDPSSASASTGAAPSDNAADVPQRAEWYIFRQGKQYGPVSLLQLEQWIEARQLLSTDFVKFQADGEWEPPEVVRALIAALTAGTNGSAAPATVAPATAASAAIVNRAGGAGTQATKPAESATAEPATPGTAATASRANESTDPARSSNAPAAMSASASTSGGFSAGAAAPRSFTPPSPPPMPARPVARPPVKSKSKSSGGGFDIGGLLGDSRTLMVGGGALAALALVAVFFFVPLGSGPALKYYEKLNEIRGEISQLRARSAPAAQWSALLSKYDPEITEMVKDLKGRADRSQPVYQHLLWASEFRLREVFKNEQQKPGFAEKDFLSNLENAGRLLGKLDAAPAAPSKPDSKS